MPSQRTIRVSPYPSHHPLLWALTDLAGMSLTDVAARSRVPRRALLRLARGYDLRPDHRAPLVAALDWARGQMVQGVPTARDSPPALREYRRAVFALVDQILRDYADPAPVLESRRRDSDLAEAISAYVGRGAPRRQVLGALCRAHDAKVVRRAARRLGFASVRREGVWWWYPPPPYDPSSPSSSIPATPHFPPPAVQTTRAPSTDLQRRVHDAVALYLGRSPDGVAEAKLVVAHVVDRCGCSAAYVYRQARDMNLNRERRGYAATLRMWWGLPHVAVVAPDRDDDDSPVIDFSSG